MCEDYRAAATIDFALDEEDRGVRQIGCPVLAMSGIHAQLEACYDVLSVWRDWANDVQRRAFECGHYLAEEASEETFASLGTFFAG